jgi:hypothetical protein
VKILQPKRIVFEGSGFGGLFVVIHVAVQIYIVPLKLRF